MLIDDLREGKTKYGKPDKTIETVLSFIFIFGHRVLKVYKHRKTFYGDMSEQSFRKHFYDDDFSWSKAAAPDIYLALRSFGIGKTRDWAIEMRRIDASNDLTNLLPAGKLRPIDMSTIALSIVRILSKLSHKKKKLLTKYSYHEYIEDLDAWIKNLHPHIPLNQSREIISKLSKIAHEEPYFKKNAKKFSIAIDSNSDNLLFIDGKPSYIDIMPPKKEWRVSDPQFCITRLSVDAEVLGNKILAQRVHTVREKAHGKLPKKALLAYQLHAASIQWAYRTELKQSGLAKKYRTFILDLLSKI